MTRLLRSRAARPVPVGQGAARSRKTTTFVDALRRDGLGAPMVLDGPMTGQAFLAYVEQVLPRRTGSNNCTLSL
jgi:hypothetical protein